METISIFDGLVLTLVSMLVVFLVLASIWGLVELIAKLVNGQEPETVSLQPVKKQATTLPAEGSKDLPVNKKHQQAAEFISLVLASEDQPNKKFEITDSKRVK